MDFLSFEFLKIIKSLINSNDDDDISNIILVKKIIGITKTKKINIKELFNDLEISEYKIKLLTHVKNNNYTNKTIYSLFNNSNFISIEKSIYKYPEIKQTKLLLRRANRINSTTDFNLSWDINPLIAPNQQYKLNNFNVFDETFTILVTEKPIKRIIGMQAPILYLDIDYLFIYPDYMTLKNRDKDFLNFNYVLSDDEIRTYYNYNMTANYSINILISEFESQSYKTPEGNYHFSFQPINTYPFSSSVRLLNLDLLSHGTKLIGDINPYTFTNFRNYRDYKAVNEGFYWFQTPYDTINKISLVLKCPLDIIPRSYIDMDMVLTLLYLEESD